MFFRMLLRPLLVRRGSSAIAILAVVVASTAATAMLTLFSDVQAKLRGEFRSYGANIIVTANPAARCRPTRCKGSKASLAPSGTPLHSGI